MPLWGQLLAVGELLIRTIGTGKDALATSTADTEWNGELIDRDVARYCLGKKNSPREEGCGIKSTSDVRT